MAFPDNDRYWIDTVEFLRRSTKANDKVLAPREFKNVISSVISYDSFVYVDLDEGIQWIVVHKGMMECIEYSIIEKIKNGDYLPFFANEVFVVLSDRSKTNSLEKDTMHLQSFWKTIGSIKKSVKESVKKITNKPELSEENSIRSLLQLSKDGKPNINELNTILRDMKAIRLNIKNLGYELARDLRRTNLDMDENFSFQSVNLQSKATTQEDVESKWLKYWCQQLKIDPIYHRKIWELCYVPQAIYNHFGASLKLSGIGFGCGQEPLPSLFASMGWEITVTDLHPDKVKGLGWMETGQHTNMLEQAFFAHIVNREAFTENVGLKYVDMNEIPEDLYDSYDFCWSICALEHLGSIKNGLNFIENSLKVLKSGGIAVHTTEYNYTNEPETIDNWPTVIFQNHHFEEISKRLVDLGYQVAELNFDVGSQPLDRFIDIPPFAIGEGWLSKDTWGNTNQGAHLKLSVDGYPCTCFGLIIKKN
jgi:SAM-dependent methyltransferase